MDRFVMVGLQKNDMFDCLLFGLKIDVNSVDKEVAHGVSYDSLGRIPAMT